MELLICNGNKEGAKKKRHLSLALYLSLFLQASILTVSSYKGNKYTLKERDLMKI